MFNHWKNSWGNPSAWGVSWGATVPVPAPAALSGAAGGGRLWREWEFADLQAELEWRSKKRQKEEALLILLGVL